MGYKDRLLHRRSKHHRHHHGNGLISHLKYIHRHVVIIIWSMRMKHILINSTIYFIDND